MGPWPDAQNTQELELEPIPSVGLEQARQLLKLKAKPPAVVYHCLAPDRRRGTSRRSRCGGNPARIGLCRHHPSSARRTLRPRNPARWGIRFVDVRSMVPSTFECAGTCIWWHRSRWPPLSVNPNAGKPLLDPALQLLRGAERYHPPGERPPPARR